MGLFSGLGNLAAPLASLAGNYFAPGSGALAGGIVNSVFNRPKDPFAQAQPYLNQASQMARENYQPYIQNALGAMQNTTPLYNRMSQNPNDYLNEILSQYSPSKGYQFKEDRLKQVLHNTAASGGFAGTPEHQYEAGSLVKSLLNEDMQEFLNNIRGIQGTGLAGLEHQVERGHQAATGLSNSLSNNYSDLATGAYNSGAYQNANKQNEMANLLRLMQQGYGFGQHNGWWG